MGKGFCPANRRGDELHQARMIGLIPCITGNELPNGRNELGPYTTRNELPKTCDQKEPLSERYML
jgi:hypothetical protein